VRRLSLLFCLCILLALESSCFGAPQSQSGLAAVNGRFA